MVALNYGFFNHHIKKRFELTAFLTASLDYLLQEIFEALDGAFVVGDEIFISNHFNKVVKRSQAAWSLWICGFNFWRNLILLHLKNLVENWFNIIILNQAPEDLSAIHAEESSQNRFIFLWKSFIFLKLIDFSMIGITIIEFFNSNIIITSIDIVVKTSFHLNKNFRLFLWPIKRLLINFWLHFEFWMLWRTTIFFQKLLQLSLPLFLKFSDVDQAIIHLLDNLGEVNCPAIKRSFFRHDLLSNDSGESAVFNEIINQLILELSQPRKFILV